MIVTIIESGEGWYNMSFSFCFLVNDQKVRSAYKVKRFG